MRKKRSEKGVGEGEQNTALLLLITFGRKDAPVKIHLV
jgi:hypothetical protein